MPPAYEILLLNTSIPQIQAAQAGDTYVVPRDIAVTADLSVTGNTTLGDASTDTVRVNGYMGVGAVPSSTTALFINSTALTGISQTGIFVSPTGTSSATGTIAGVIANPKTEAAAFTVSQLRAFEARDATKGAGSTITNQHGVYIADQTQGTNNYGITSLVSSGTNKWNIYASGTAANYFAGNVGIGTSSPAGLLQVQSNLAGNNQILLTNLASSNSGAGSEIVFTQGASGYAAGKIQCDREGSYSATASSQDSALVFFTATDGVDAERLRIDSSGNVGIGITPSAKLTVADVSAGATIEVLKLVNNASGANTQAKITFNTSGSNYADISGGYGAAAPELGFSIQSTQRFKLTSTEAVFNDPGNDYDFRVESDTNTHALFVEGTNSNVKVGGSAERATTVGTNHLDIFDGTAPVGTLINGISLYSSSGEAYVMDAAGNATLFSPHDAETNEWIFKSKHTPSGKVLKIDVEKMLRFINDHFGLDAIHEFTEE